MLKTGDTKRRLGIMLVVLAVLVVGITATGYADPTERVSGPALVGTLSLVQTDPSLITVTFDGKCRGNGAFFSVPLSGTLPTTAANLAGFRLPGTGPSGCLDATGGQDLIVKAVSKFKSNGAITADVVLLFVVTP